MNLIPTWFKALLIGCFIGFVLHTTYQAGAEQERSKWLLKTALQTVSNQVDQLKKERSIRVLENRLASSAVEISTYHQGVMNEKLKQKDRTIAGLRNGSVRLSVAVTGSGAACKNSSGNATADQPEAVRETRAELSTEAAEFLVDFGSECDAVTIESNEVKDHLIECRAALSKLQMILRE